MGIIGHGLVVQEHGNWQQVRAKGVIQGGECEIKSWSVVAKFFAGVCLKSWLAFFDIRGHFIPSSSCPPGLYNFFVCQQIPNPVRSDIFISFHLHITPPEAEKLGGGWEVACLISSLVYNFQRSTRNGNYS